METNPAPTMGTNRLESMDVIRGLALLGILVMNIQAFALPMAAYSNPLAWGNFGGLNEWVWTLGHILVDAKFMSMFALLFGAGMVLFCERLEARQIRAFPVHVRRMGWLALFGLIHAHLIWWGDVLFPYAICGLVLYRARTLPIRSLWVLGSALFSVAFVFILLIQLSVPFMTEDEWLDLVRDWQPEMAIMQAEIDDMRGTWQQQFAFRTSMATMMETYGLLVLIFWQAGGLMLAGMALYREGLFSGQLATKQLIRRTTLFLLSGFSLVLGGLIYNHAHGWTAESSMLGGSLFNYVGSALVALGYVHLMVLLVQLDRIRKLRRGLARIGRMAFSNYIAQSLICTSIFYGFGLSLFGQLTRWQLVLIVILVWLMQWFGSRWWLARYRYGPLEWVWRRLTYWQPLANRP